ncbi:MAG: hypothetical protein QXG39_00170 [Candidatus Aenigmatarchaeota archaeon]
MKKEWVMLVATTTLLAGILFINFNPEKTGIAENIGYKGVMCYQVVRQSGAVEQNCIHNVYTNMGKNITRDRLGWAVGSPINVIGVGNGSAPTETSTFLNNEINECGISRSAGTVSIVETSPGNFSIQKQYSITCFVPKVNITGLYNSTTGNFLFAGATISPEVTNLNSGDTLTITWYIWTS